MIDTITTRPTTDELQRVLVSLAGRRCHLEDEKMTQAEIVAALAAAGLTVDREVKLRDGIIDAVVTFHGLRTVGVEVKLKGQPAAILRQLERYAADSRIDALVLVTAKAVPLPAMLRGKRLAVVDLGRAWL